MSRPTHRASPGIRISRNGHGYGLWDSENKDRKEKEDMEKSHSSDQIYVAQRFPFWFLSHDNNNSPSKYGVSENGFASDPFSTGIPRSRHNFMMLFLKLSIVVIVIFALTGSFWWAISISTSSRSQLSHNFRKLQEQLVSDLWEIGEISVGSPRSREVEFCTQDAENYVPCFNVSQNLAEGNELDRHCEGGSRQNCLVLPPVNYRIPLRWPTGRDVIWVANVKITAQEVLSSGSMTKR